MRRTRRVLDAGDRRARRFDSTACQRAQVVEPRDDHTRGRLGASRIDPRECRAAASLHGEAAVTIAAPVPAAPIQSCHADCAPPGKPNGVVNFDDLVEVINAITTQNLDCDVAPDNGDGTFGNGVVNFDDLVEVINNFGPCK